MRGGDSAVCASFRTPPRHRRYLPTQGRRSDSSVKALQSQVAGRKNKSRPISSQGLANVDRPACCLPSADDNTAPNPAHAYTECRETPCTFCFVGDPNRSAEPVGRFCHEFVICRNRSFTQFMVNDEASRPSRMPSLASVCSVSLKIPTAHPTPPGFGRRSCGCRGQTCRDWDDSGAPQ